MIRPGEFGEGNVFELLEQALTQYFGCDAGVVGNKESRSFHLSPGGLKLMANLGYDRRDFAVPQWAAFSLIFQVQATSAGECSY